MLNTTFATKKGLAYTPPTQPYVERNGEISERAKTRNGEIILVKIVLTSLFTNTFDLYVFLKVDILSENDAISAGFFDLLCYTCWRK